MVNFIVSVCLAFTVIISFFPSNALGKPQPVVGIMLMYDAFNKMEGEFRTQKWNESKESIRYIQSYYARLSQELKKTVDIQTVNKFGFYVSRLNRIIETQDQDAIEDSYMELQRLFLEIMSYYDYSLPPTLIIYQRYIDEAIEGLEKENFVEIAGEMIEILELRNLGEISFKEKGVPSPEIDKFFQTIEKVEKEAQGKNLTAARQGLRDLEEFISKYMQNK